MRRGRVNSLRSRLRGGGFLLAGAALQKFRWAELPVVDSRAACGSGGISPCDKRGASATHNPVLSCFRVDQIALTQRHPPSAPV